MAFAANTAWEVRTTGSNANGGGFNTAATGTDYSQQNSPQVAFTDLVIGTTTTNLTSVLNPFTSAHVGNIINITGGTGFTVQRVQIVSVASGVATCDKACGTAASIAGTGNLGGGLLTIATALALMVLGNTTWIQTGTYNITSGLTVPASTYISGYSVTHGDDAAKATISATAGSYTMMSPSAAISSIVIKNIVFTSPSMASGLIGIQNISFTGGWTFINCDFSNLGNAIETTSAFQIVAFGCTFINCGTGISGGAGGVSPYQITVDSCYFNNLSVSAIEALGSFNLTVKNSIFSTITDYAIEMTSGARSVLIIENCNFTGCGLAAIQLSLDWNPSTGTSGNALVLRNNIIYGNTRFGVEAGGTSLANLPQQYVCSNNAVGSNPSGNYNNLVSTGDITLTASPWVGAPNFNLNSTSGGGASCKGAGWPGPFPGATGSTSSPDIGAIQGSSTGGTISNYGYTG